MLGELLIAAAVLNLVAFAAFGIDKRKARRGAWRIPEAHLLFLAFAGGLFGAWAGRRVFHHKTRKTRFTAVLVLVSVVNLLWLGLWLVSRS